MRLEQIFDRLKTLLRERTLSWQEQSKLLLTLKQKIADYEQSQQKSSQLIQNLKDYISKIESETTKAQGSLTKAQQSLNVLEKANKRLKAQKKIFVISRWRRHCLCGHEVMIKPLGRVWSGGYFYSLVSMKTYVLKRTP